MSDEDIEVKPLRDGIVVQDAAQFKVPSKRKRDDECEEEGEEEEGEDDDAGSDPAAKKQKTLTEKETVAKREELKNYVRNYPEITLKTDLDSLQKVEELEGDRLMGVLEYFKWQVSQGINRTVAEKIVQGVVKMLPYCDKENLLKDTLADSSFMDPFTRKISDLVQKLPDFLKILLFGGANFCKNYQSPQVLVPAK